MIVRSRFAGWDIGILRCCFSRSLFSQHPMSCCWLNLICQLLKGYPLLADSPILGANLYTDRDYLNRRSNCHGENLQ